MLSADGLGKMLLSERRVGPVNALKSFFEKMSGGCPDIQVLWSECLPSTVECGAVLFVPNHRDIEDFEKVVGGYPDDVMVICAQELCHQVSAVFRFR